MFDYDDFPLERPEHLDITLDDATSAFAEHIKIAAHSCNPEDFVILHFEDVWRKHLALEEFEIMRHWQNENYIVSNRVSYSKESYKHVKNFNGS